MLNDERLIDLSPEAGQILRFDQQVSRNIEARASSLITLSTEESSLLKTRSLPKNRTRIMIASIDGQVK